MLKPKRSALLLGLLCPVVIAAGCAQSTPAKQAAKARTPDHVKSTTTTATAPTKESSTTTSTSVAAGKIAAPTTTTKHQRATTTTTVGSATAPSGASGLPFATS